MTETEGTYNTQTIDKTVLTLLLSLQVGDCHKLTWCCLRLHCCWERNDLLTLEVSREAETYCVLQGAQGSAVPVFIGAIDLATIYFLHVTGEIRHMLPFRCWWGVVGWGSPE